ncbi:MAG: ABC transporter ATP-binding protein [Herpetosiphonaceae bacterium]|nr:ABC transporter ATP-binding protein [Herpetosiphonaceae bacterium]
MAMIGQVQEVPAIAVHNLSKRYGNRLTVDNLNMTVAPGKVLGFLGPNGAGKTTTIRLMMGFLRPTVGHIKLLGYDVQLPKEALLARGQLGFVPDVAGLDPAARGLRLLDELARLQARSPIDREFVCPALELDPADLKRPIGALSRGTRQKINIVQGLQHRPALLILDEPTEGLDPLGKQALFELLRAARDRGTTIFFSSHVLSEVEELCDHVALLRKGCLVAMHHLAELRDQLYKQVVLRLTAPEPSTVSSRLAGLPSLVDLHHENDVWHFRVGELQPLLRLIAALPVRDVTIEPSSLADIFLQYYRSGEAPHDQ